MEFGETFIILACGFGLFMAWGIGANDVANAMGTSVGSGVISLKQAFIIAAVFEFAGATLAGGQVTNTIHKEIIDVQVMSGNPDILVYGMLAALLASGTWLLIASRFGWPVSTTHTIVGAIVGFAVTRIGFEVVAWGELGTIVMSWIVSPALAGFVSYWIFQSIQKFILRGKDPLKNARRYVPIYIFLAGFVISLISMFKGLKHVGLELSNLECYSIAVMNGLLVMITGIYFIEGINFDSVATNNNRDTASTNVEKIFSVLMVVTACSMAFAHGSNDAANAIGPVAAVLGVIQSGGEITQKSVLPPWLLVLGGAGIVLGLFTYGERVIQTIVKKITRLTYSGGFTAELAAALTIVLASGAGLPISTTHTLVGSVMGVGLASGVSSLNFPVLGKIVTSWIITLPVGAVLSILFFYIINGIFS